MIPDKILGMMDSLIDGGYDAYIVGGAVRDIMTCQRPADWDIFTNANGDDILSIFPNGKIIGGDKRREKILTVIVSGVEISQYRSNGDRTETGISLDRHLSTCDFTMNSMAMNIDTRIIDNHYGMADIRNKFIRCVGDARERIEEDKMRAFRAIRFAVKYGFSIDKELSRVIYYTDIDDLPIERIKNEILKIIMYPGGLEMLNSSDLLNKIIPEFEGSLYLDGGSNHNETVDQHMYNAQSEACMLTDNPVLVFACALHDIGKSYVHGHNENGNVTFYEHEKVGAKLLSGIMKRMKFSNANIAYVNAIVSEHMFGGEQINTLDRTFVKHFRKFDNAGVRIEDYMVMKYSDRAANMMIKRVKFGDFVADNKLYKKYYEMKFSCVPFSVSDLAISGNDLIDIGVPAGVKIGNILNEVFDKVIKGDMENKRHVLMHFIKHMKDK
jgi:tRNA nucleotidyltransferase (CCA-adding enzyme)